MPEHAPCAGKRKPHRALTLRALCAPADTHQNGDIFGGWLLGEMDIAGEIFAHPPCAREAPCARKGGHGRGRRDGFKRPVHVGDVICLHADPIRVGTTSIAAHVQVWALRRKETEQQKETSRM